MTQTTTSKPSSLLSIKNLTISLTSSPGTSPVVRNLTFDVSPGECVGIVGESGSGKSLSSLAILNMLPSGVHISNGSVIAEGIELTKANEKELRRLRGSLVSMIFQDPGAALNPSRTVGKLLADVLRAHSKLSRKQIKERSIAILGDVGFPDAENRLNNFPFQLSGGLRQRVAIAIALVNRPSILVADEPTTSLDVSVQKGILELIHRRTVEENIGCIFVSHDLGVIAEVADRVVIMYSGQVVEEGPVASVLTHPKHPYTKGLIDSAPNMSSTLSNPLRPIPGSLPPIGRTPSGCAFQDRCLEKQSGSCSPDDPTWSTDPQDSTHRWLCHKKILRD